MDDVENDKQIIIMFENDECELSICERDIISTRTRINSH